MDPIIGVAIGVLSFAVGILGSHATLGKDVRQALTEIKNLGGRMDSFERRPVHYHRRAGDEDA